MHVWPVYDIEPSPSVSHCKSHGLKATGVVTKETGGSSLGKHDMRSFKNTLKKQGLIKLSIFFYCTKPRKYSNDSNLSETFMLNSRVTCLWWFFIEN